MRTRKIMLGAVIGGLTAALASSAVSAEAVKIRMGWIVPVNNLAPVLFAKDGVAKHSGKSYLYEPVRFQGSPAEVTALASGDLEIANLGWSSVGIAR